MIFIILFLLVLLADCPAYSIARWERADIIGRPVTCVYGGGPDNQYELSGIILGRRGW